MSVRVNTDPERCPHTTCHGCPTPRKCVCPPCACPACQRRTLIAKNGHVGFGMRGRSQVPRQDRLFEPELDPIREAARRW